MELVRINDELRIDAQAAQCLIHLLAALNGHVEIAFTAHEKRGRFDAIGVQKRIRELHILFPRGRIPGRPDLVVVLNDVLVGAVERNRKGRPRATCRGFKAGVRCDQVVSQNTAVAPSAHREAIRIGHTDLDGVVDTGEQILHFVVAPVGPNRAREFLAAAGAAAVVHIEDGISFRREKLALGAEAVGVLPIRSAVNPQ